MEKKLKNAIEEYQCSGCIVGGDISCFKKNTIVPESVGCGNHSPGTMISGIGTIFLGMPKGFNRLGQQENMKIFMFDDFDSSEVGYNMWNVPTWKHLNELGHTLVRGLRPRKNEAFLHIFLENCMDKINCLEITEEQISKMD